MSTIPSMPGPSVLQGRNVAVWDRMDTKFLNRPTLNELLGLCTVRRRSFRARSIFVAMTSGLDRWLVSNAIAKKYRFRLRSLILVCGMAATRQRGRTFARVLEARKNCSVVDTFKLFSTQCENLLTSSFHALHLPHQLNSDFVDARTSRGMEPCVLLAPPYSLLAHLNHRMSGPRAKLFSLDHPFLCPRLLESEFRFPPPSTFCRLSVLQTKHPPRCAVLPPWCPIPLLLLE